MKNKSKINGGTLPAKFVIKRGKAIRTQCDIGRQLHQMAKALTETSQSREHLMQMGVYVKKLGTQLILLGQ